MVRDMHGHNDNPPACTVSAQVSALTTGLLTPLNVSLSKAFRND